ncbi:MAG: hypothetical protein FWC75_07240 [Oscillospiraceae bacterium]|nr:hypothetical protein [Oscillospiraceae bacterium]
MRIASFLMPFVAIVTGIAGFVIRKHELAYVFDAQTGLPERGSLITLVLIGLTVLFILAALIFSIVVSKRKVVDKGFENVFGTDSLSYPISFILFGLLWLWASIMYFVDFHSAGNIRIIFSVMAAISAISVIFFAVEMYQDPRRKSVYALSVIPSLFTCLWLILVYRENAANPVLLSYAYQILAIIASTMGFYFTSGVVYGKPKHGKTIFSYLIAIFFCLVTLADAHNIMIRIMFCAMILISVACLHRLLRNLKCIQ